MRNTTITGFFLRTRLKRHLVLRFWDMMCNVIAGRDLAAAWQPTATPCHICQAPIERRARFCGVCGAAQQVAGGPLATRGKNTVPETEEIQLAEIQRLGWVDTKRLYPVRLGAAGPMEQLTVQKHAWLHAELRRQYPKDAEALIAAAERQGYARLLDWLCAARNQRLVRQYHAWQPTTKKKERSHVAK